MLHTRIMAEQRKGVELFLGMLMEGMCFVLMIPTHSACGSPCLITGDAKSINRSMLAPVLQRSSPESELTNGAKAPDYW